jgi:TIGR03790 family protein
MTIRRTTALLPFFLITCLLSVYRPAQAQSPIHPEVLVVYNANFPDSLTVANYYMTQRGIPAANLCAISPPSSTILSMADYVSTVKTPIRACLTSVGRTQVLYIVFSYLTPYKIEASLSYAIDSYVSDIWDLYTTKDFNPVPTAPHRYYAASQSQGNVFAPFVSLATYRTLPKSTLLYSVWRLDGMSLALAQGLVDKAMQAEQAGGLVGQGCFDTTVDANLVYDAVYKSADWSLHMAAQFMTQANFGVTEDTNPEEFGTAPAPLTCPNTAVYSGWYSYNTYNDAFSWNTGAIGFHLDSASALDPRGGTNWSANAVIHGIAVTSGAVSEPYLEGLARPGGVFRNLLEGSNVGDAFLRNTQWVKWMILNIGDPLYTPFPGTPAGRAPFNQGLAVNSLALNPQQVVGSSSFIGNSTATITLSAPAPMGGTTFNLSSDQPGAASVPASVIVPAGSSKATFPVTTSTVTAAAFVKISASGPVTLNNTLQVYPLLGGISFSQSTVSAGQTITGTVLLNDRAPTGGALVTLSSSNTAVATVPASVTVPAGSAGAPFSIPTSIVSASTPTTISATYAGTTVTATLTAVPAIRSVDVGPPSVAPGATSAFEVYLATPAPAGGAVVMLTNGSPSVATLAAGSSITIPAGAVYGQSLVTTNPSAASGATDQITASFGGDSKQATLTIQ